MLLTIKELADREGRTELNVRQWIRRHKLPPTRIGSRIYIDTEVFERWKVSLTAVAPVKFVPPTVPARKPSRIAAKMTPLPEKL